MTAYGGVYRAKVVECAPLSTHIKVHVPHLFGAVDVPIPLSQIVADPSGTSPDPRPGLGDRGYVAFENGQAELPVWLGTTIT